MGRTTTAPEAVELELMPFLEATSVLVRMLFSSVAMISTFLFDALGVLILPKEPRAAAVPRAVETPPSRSCLHCK